MTIIQRHIVKTVLGHFVFALLAVVAIYIAVEFFERIDDFLEKKAPLSLAAEFFLLRIPYVIDQVAPVGVLLAVLVTFGLMARHNELMACRAAGASPLHLLRPVLAFGLFATAGLFFWGEAVVPLTSGRANQIWYHEVQKEQAHSLRENDIWVRQGGLIARFGSLPAGQNVAGQVSINYLDKDFRLTRKYDAPKAVYVNSAWRLLDCAVQTRLPDGTYSVEHKDKESVNLGLSPADLSRVTRRSDEMGYLELTEYVEKVRRQGFDAARYRVDLAAKLAFPFVCLILCALGGSMGLSGKRGGGLAVSVVLGIAVAFGYWVAHGVALSLGRAGALPPWAAAWTANAVFAALSAVSVARLR
jgi:lipopolysaccharide export system permease protein